MRPKQNLGQRCTDKPYASVDRTIAGDSRWGSLGRVAEQAYQDLVQISDPKPYVSLEDLRNIQRLIKIQNPPIGNVKLEELIDNRR